MSYFFQGKLCIINGSVIEPELIKGAQVKTQNDVILGEITWGDRKSLSVKIDENLLFKKDAQITIEFLVDLVMKIEDNNGRMVLVVSDGQFMNELNLINDHLLQMPFSGISMLVTMYEKPYVKRYMELFREKRRAYLERLKYKERKFLDKHMRDFIRKYGLG